MTQTLIQTILVLTAFGFLFGCGSAQRPDGGKGLLPVGAAAPDVTGVDQNSAPHKLSEALGKPVVVYFYPKDQTPGCTKEACAFRDVWKKYEAAGVLLFGVSNGTPDSHKEFATKHTLPFPLIADSDRVWANAFGVPSMAGMYKRVSFLIGKDGKVLKVYDNVDPGVHAEEVLKDATSTAP